MKQSLLWKIEGEGITSVSYLFGTMHVQDSKAFFAYEKAWEKIRLCEAFAAEFHLGSAAMEFDSVTLLLPAGQTLRTLLPEKKYRKLRSIFLKSVGLDLDYVQHSLPFALVNMLTGRILASDMPESLDEYLWHLAEKEGKIMFGIETLTEQMAVVQKIPLAVQLKMLLSIGKNISRYREHLLHMTNLYAQEDIRQLFMAVKKNSGGLRKLLLYRRNEVMAERLAVLVRQQSIFAAIGAGHLYGGKGVLRLLKKQGLKLKPIAVAASHSTGQ